MVAPFKGAFGIDQDVGDILDVADFVDAAAHFQQRVVARRAGVGRVEEQAVGEACTPAGGQFPVLALDVVDHRRSGPAAQRRRSEEHTSELQSLMRISYAVFCLKKNSYDSENRTLLVMLYNL